MHEDVFNELSIHDIVIQELFLAIQNDNDAQILVPQKQLISLTADPFEIEHA